MVEWFGGRCSIWFSSTQWSTCLIQTNLNAFLFWWLGKFFLYTEIDFEPIITVALFIRRYSLHQNLIISAVDQPKSNVFNFLPPSNSPLSYPTSHHNTIISLNFHCVCPWTLVHIIPPTISLETTRKRTVLITICWTELLLGGYHFQHTPKLPNLPGGLLSIK